MQGQTGSVVTKVGLWGGPGGSVQETTEPPNRLHSLTILAGEAIDAIEFTYTGKDGQRRTGGRWGGLGCNARRMVRESNLFYLWMDPRLLNSEPVFISVTHVCRSILATTPSMSRKF
jgi:hypothetical protein